MRGEMTTSRNVSILLEIFKSMTVSLLLSVTNDTSCKPISNILRSVYISDCKFSIYNY